jgi:peptidoglycan/LPS O-acetylase OafA/YrhL
LNSRVKNGYIPTLDGLRAVAISLVIFSHTTDYHIHPAIVSTGFVGVAIFFALSGYLITSRLLEEYEKNGRISLRNFYIRRAFRILPPAVFYLGTVWILTFTGVVICNRSAIRAALLFYINYTHIDGSAWRVGNFWSLAVEEHFYFLWPALLILFGLRKGWRTAAVGAVAISIWRILDDHFFILSRLFHESYLNASSLRTDLTADVLLWGCCLAFLLRKPPAKPLGAVPATIIAICSGSLLIALHDFPIANHVTILVHILPTVLLGALVAAPNAPIGRFLEFPVMRFIGRISYSLYIWQQLFLGGSGPRLPMPFALAAILACALFSYAVIERPLIRFGRRLLRSGSKSVSHSADPVFNPIPRPDAQSL